ncbi:replication protein [Rosenbergiella epipactidis]|uniref:replication protein n=1 Tax=Rosenbergiella epipactidis TaxID=1544694 RepID=UPI001F4F3176|nr:replication protein [Rosenbergiella epipactidis]
MSNLAYINVSPIRPIMEPVEAKVAQLEDGYLRLANELLDATMSSGLPETELCILMAVWRKTYGYSKKMDWISNEQLESMIDKHFTHCSTAKNNLIRKKVLIQEGRKIGMNTNISEWETKNNGFCKTLAKPAKKTLATSANQPLQKLLTTKDNIQNTIKTTPISPEGNDSVDQKSKPEKPNRKRNKSSPVELDHQRFIDTWNCKADKFGLPRMNVITKTTADGINRLYRSHVKYCKQSGAEPADVDTMINGYIEFGYTPTEWACGKNPDGKRFGIDTALTQKKIDEILSSED